MFAGLSGKSCMANETQEVDRSIEDIEIIPGFLRKIWRIGCLGEIATRCSTANIRPWREALFIDYFMYLISPWRKMVLQTDNLRKCITTNMNHLKVNRSFRAPGEFQTTMPQSTRHIRPDGMVPLCAPQHRLPMKGLPKGLVFLIRKQLNLFIYNLLKQQRNSHNHGPLAIP